MRQEILFVLVVAAVALGACTVGALVATTPGGSPLALESRMGQAALPMTVQMTIPLAISMYMLYQDEWLTVVCPVTQTVAIVDGSLAGSGPNQVTLDCR